MLKLRRQLAIDMGSSKIRFARSDSQEIYEDWNVVALQHRNRFATVLAAVGQEAMNMADTPNVEIVWPLENGVVWDYQVTEVSLFAYHRKHHRFHFFVPQVIAAVPAGSSEAEKRTLYDAVRSAFGDRVVLMEDLLAVGMAVGLDKGDAIIPKFLLHMGPATQLLAS